MKGLGFRELDTFNVALLTKMVDRVNNEPSSLWVRVLKGLYYPRGDFLSARRGGRASCGWSSILRGRDALVREGLWEIGSHGSVRKLVLRWI